MGEELTHVAAATALALDVVPEPLLVTSRVLAPEAVPAAVDADEVLPAPELELEWELEPHAASAIVAITGAQAMVSLRHEVPNAPRAPVLTLIEILLKPLAELLVAPRW